MEELSFKVSIKPTWKIVQEIRDETQKIITKKGKDKDVIDAIMMCVSELIENAVKYGSAVSESVNIDFNMNWDENTVKIQVSNGVQSDKDAKNIIDRIEKIKMSNDPAKLYVDRLMELLENPRQGASQLGLYRIAYEGGFKINYSYKDQVLTIFAEKDV